jgi:hypothetical protein
MASFRSRFVAWLVWVEVDRSHSIALQPAADGDDEFQVALADLVEIKLLFRMALVDAHHQRAAAVKPRPHQRLIDLALDEEPVLKILDGLSALAAHLPRLPLPWWRRAPASLPDASPSRCR